MLSPLVVATDVGAWPEQSITDPSATPDPGKVSAVWYRKIRISLPSLEVRTVDVVNGFVALSSALLNP